MTTKIKVETYHNYDSNGHPIWTVESDHLRCDLDGSVSLRDGDEWTELYFGVYEDLPSTPPAWGSPALQAAWPAVMAEWLKVRTAFGRMRNGLNQCARNGYLFLKASERQSIGP